MPPGHIPFTLFGHPEQYCSRECAKIALEAFQKEKAALAKKKPNEPTTATPRLSRCDRCGTTITSDMLKWPGKDGVYCSNYCLTQAEPANQSGDNDMTDEQTAEATTAQQEPPIVAGRTMTKTKAKAKAKKQATKKHAPAAKHSANGAKSAAKPAVKKAAPAPSKDDVIDPYGVFRSNTAKAAVAVALSDGKWHEAKELEDIVAGYGITVAWALFDVREILLKKCGIEVEMNADRSQWRAKKPVRK